MDDEKLIYPFYEKILKAGHDIVCVHKGLYPPSTEQRFPHLTPYADGRRRRQGGEGLAADQLRHLPLGLSLDRRRRRRRGRLAQFEQTGRVEWTSDLAEIPAKYGVSNVYADLGQIFAQTTVTEPRLCAALMGMLVKGMGADHVVWGTDAVWTGSPQWQIEALRRLEIPEDMQKKYGFAALGPGRRPGQDGDLRRELGEDVPLRRQEGGLERRSLRRDQVRLRAARPRAVQPALRLRRAEADGDASSASKLHSVAGLKVDGDRTRGTNGGIHHRGEPPQPAEGGRRGLRCSPSRRARCAAQAKIAPPNIIKAGTLVMSINPTLPPLQFVDDKGELQGMRVELANECCKRLGLAPEYIRTEFATMIPGLAAKRWDMINTGIFWTEERSKLMYMVPYEQAAISFLAAKGNPLGLKTVDDLAGKRISVELGGIEERRTREVAKMVTEEGPEADQRA